MLSSPSRGITQIAFLRLESLWESWCESRYANRILITKSILLNIQMIIDFGSLDDLRELLLYAQDFEDNLKESVSEKLAYIVEELDTNYVPDEYCERFHPSGTQLHFLFLNKAS